MSGSLEYTTLGQALPESCGVCVINLSHREDRWEDFQQNMLPHLAPLEVHRIPAVEGIRLPGFGLPPLFRGRPRDKTWAARAGCTLSHRAALMHAHAACWSHVLVLEDDIQMPSLPEPNSLFDLRLALESLDPDICYLGFTDPVSPFRELTCLGANRALHQVFGCNAAHAYIVSKRAIVHLLEILPQPEDIWHWLTRHRAVDRFYYRNLSPTLTVTAVSPPLIEQKPGFSDIIGRNVTVHSEMHKTTIDSHHPDPGDYEKHLVFRASTFTRKNRIDFIRGWWKSIRGF
jgi:glycosyl transferase family 25